MSELGQKARSIVDAGRDGDAPSAADRARVRGAVMRSIAAGGAIAATTAASGAAAGSAASGAKAGAATKLILAGKAIGVVKILATVTVVGALGLAARSLSMPAAPRAAATAPTASGAAPPGAPSVTANTPPAADLPAASAHPDMPMNVPPADPTMAASAPSPPSAQAAPRPALTAARPAASGAPDDSLAEETRRLGEAHGALKDDPRRALALLDEQSSAYAGGQLREERAAARILALCQLGRTTEASAEAARFLRESPRSPLADRVRASCAGSDGR